MARVLRIGMNVVRRVITILLPPRTDSIAVTCDNDRYTCDEDRER